MYKVEFVEINENKIPFVEFINLLNNDEKIEIFSSIDKLCELRNNKIQIPSKLSKLIRDGIFEIRIQHRNRISRCLYFYFFGERIIITHGFIKKTDKVPEKEITKAQRIRELFLNKQKDKS